MNRYLSAGQKKITILLIIVLLISLFLMLRGCFHEVPSIPFEPTITLYLSQENKIIKIGLEEYIVGSVAAEMPSSFPLEALKAQAVCARTYALRKIAEKHPYPLGADVTDDTGNCQAYVSRDEFARLHPYQHQELMHRIESAVTETRGEILTYQNQPIDALYHSTCGGMTESALDAWGQDIPYLQSRKCKYCQQSKYFESVQVFSMQELHAIFPEYNGGENSIEVYCRSQTGRVKSLAVCDHEYSGSRIRELLRLPSTWWKFEVDGEELRVTSKGYGHGVGMCQYGAGGMAQAGKNYKQILQYYYPHTKLYRLDYERKKDSAKNARECS